MAQIRLVGTTSSWGITTSNVMTLEPDGSSSADCIVMRRALECFRHPIPSHPQTTPKKPAPKPCPTHDQSSFEPFPRLERTKDQSHLLQALQRLMPSIQRHTSKADHVSLQTSSW